jgi:hypothetical protein
MAQSVNVYFFHILIFTSWTSTKQFTHVVQRFFLHAALFFLGYIVGRGNVTNNCWCNKDTG